MVTEVRPLGISCNLQCQYCYQHPARDAGYTAPQYDIERIKSAIQRVGGPFTLFGGEALLIPEKDLEQFWSWGHEQYGSNGIQTNGTLINDNHIRMFKQYKVHVGFSLDGPAELNDVRWAGTLERTRKATAKSHAALERLCREGVACSLIVTLHRGNATRDKLPVLLEWFEYLLSVGINYARLHLLETETELIHSKYALTPEENVETLVCLLEWEKEHPALKFDIFHDMRKMLLADDSATCCIWSGCDPYDSQSVQGVEWNGQSSNCGRTNKDGVDFTKANIRGFERYVTLYHTPQEYGGCKGCRFFLMCKGHCPGTSIDNDWRNRTQDCQVWGTLFEHLENELSSQGHTPFSANPLRQQVEMMHIDAWMQGQSTSMAMCLNQINNGKQPQDGRCNSGHGDTPHGDEHGDHFDNAR